jgi:hypothetical protein
LPGSGVEFEVRVCLEKFDGGVDHAVPARVQPVNLKQGTPKLNGRQVARPPVQFATLLSTFDTLPPTVLMAR